MTADKAGSEAEAVSEKGFLWQKFKDWCERCGCQVDAYFRYLCTYMVYKFNCITI